MARKTNKTAHVLNLISKAKDEHQAMEDQMKIDNTGSDVSNDLMFMGIEPSNDKSISEKINENLEALVEQDETLPVEEPQELSINNQALTNEQPMQEMTEEAPFTTVTSFPAEPTITEPETQYTEPETVPSPIMEINPEPQSQAQEELTFHYVNVYERLVLERLEEFQTMFNVCTCPRCTADVIAIALSHLPAKYIVVDNPRSIPLLSFYREKFRTPVAAQLSSACVTVNERPLH